MAARIAALSYYPIKGCAGVVVDDAMLRFAGIAHDRSSWSPMRMVCSAADGAFRDSR